jgi:hypothetical protein
MVVRCTGVCLGLTRSQRSRLVLAPEAPHVIAQHDLSQMCKHEPQNINAMHGVQRAIRCMLMHNLPIITFSSHLLLYP